MKVLLSDNFNYKKLLRFVSPPIFMMIFTSIYGVVDGFFISNFIGKTAFASVNLIMPFLMLMGSIGFMIGAGGTAIVSYLLGEKKPKEANDYFSLFVFVTFVSGIVLCIIGEIVIPYIIKLLGATEEMYDYCLLYGRVILVAIPFFMLQNLFQAFFSTAEKPTLGFVVTVIAGLTNILLDGILVGVAKMGVFGASLATAISQFLGSILPIIYFLKKNNSLLRLVKPKFSAKILLKACTNGMSEFVNNISMSVVSIFFNYQLMRLAGENGVSAYGVLMYIGFIFIAIFIGYTIGTAPIIGYNYGANNEAELKNIFKKSMILVGIFGLTMTILAISLSAPISKMYVGYDQELYLMTKRALIIFSFSFIFSGYSIFVSSMFTAFGNGLISAIVSFLRTLVFQIIAVFTLPLLLGVNGVWVSLSIAEILATIVAFAFCLAKRKKYHYA